MTVNYQSAAERPGRPVLADRASRNESSPPRSASRYRPASRTTDGRRPSSTSSRSPTPPPGASATGSSTARDRYADRYQTGVQAAGLDYQTLRNYAWVARHFEHWRRRETLSFGHHAEVASLPPAEADTWLDQAEQHGWSRNQLRLRLRESRRGNRPAGPARASQLRISAPCDRVQRWREAASRETGTSRSGSC
ncbi:LmbU family transcriptional regulator [Streptomyces thinghirensis]|nr:LmbU family transcriptional regulator [Streptomyces thinghirensis]